MTHNFKFIHAADIHLGSILHIRRKTDKDLMGIFNNAVYSSFERICNIAIIENVKFILLSGDIYDREARSVKANSFFVRQCEKLKNENIDIFIIGGNHDPVKGNKELFQLPSNVYSFSSDKAEVIELVDDKKNICCRIIGQSYKDTWDSRKMYENYRFTKDSIFTIALLHTQLDNTNNYIPCTYSDLKLIENIDYWALGHIHKTRAISIKEPIAIYPGIPQGRDLGEEGVGGALLIEVKGNKSQEIKFIKSSSVIWKNMTIKIDVSKEDEPKNLSDLENIILENAKEIINSNEVIPEGFQGICEEDGDFIKGYIVNWVIRGRGEIYELLNDKEEEIEEYFIETLNNKLVNIRPFVYTNSIEFYVGRPIESLEQLKADNNMIKAISNTSKKYFEDEELKRQLLKKLGTLWEVTENTEDINTKKLQLYDESYEAIISQAEQLIIDLLLQRGEKS